MALSEDWCQQLLKYEVTLEPPAEHGTDSGSIGRALIDGTLIVYDLDDEPGWLSALKKCLDDDGNMIVHPDGTPALRTIIESRILETANA